MDVNIINPFVRATVGAMRTMFGLTARRTDIRLKHEGNMEGDISGVMGLSGEVKGAIVISFSETTARSISGRMVGETYEAICPEVVDTIQELANVIAGQAKKELQDTPYCFNISIPTCVVGRNHVFHHLKGAPTILAIFALEGCDSFSLAVTLSVAGKPDISADNPAVPARGGP